MNPCSGLQGLVSEALTLKQRMQLVLQGQHRDFRDSFRGTYAETEDATSGCISHTEHIVKVSEALTLKQRMQPMNGYVLSSVF